MASLLRRQPRFFLQGRSCLPMPGTPPAVLPLPAHGAACGGGSSSSSATTSRGSTDAGAGPADLRIATRALETATLRAALPARPSWPPARRSSGRLASLMQLPLLQRHRGFASGSGAAYLAGDARAAGTLERARSQAVDMGFDPAELYEPWWSTDFCQQILLGLCSTTGSGALAVVAAALIMRMGLLPLNLRSLQRQCDRVALIPIYMEYAQAIQEVNKRRGGAGGTGAAGAEQAEVELARLNAKLQEFVKATSFSPLQGMGFHFTVLMPLYLVAYMALRGIVSHPDHFRNFVTTPTLWVDSLVLADPFGALPALSAMIILANAEINGASPQEGQEDAVVYFKLALRGAVLTFVPLTSLMPAAVLVFMSTNAAITALGTWSFKKYLWKPPAIDPHWRLNGPASKR